MQTFQIKHNQNNQIILALGAESAGNFSVFQNGHLYFSEDFGDLLSEQNFAKFKVAVLNFLKKNNIKPDIILSDLHPLFHTTLLAKELAKKYGAKYIPVQHHLAHIFSAIGERLIQDTSYEIRATILGIACDGTGFGLDEKIWGGEIFSFQLSNNNFQTKRIGHLENQILLGGEMAIKEPARILISILSKFLKKEEVFKQVKKYYSKNEFGVLWNQLQQNFNCPETSSTARVLDAVAVLLGFAKNERLSKHGPIELLEKNSTKPYALKPKLEISNFHPPAGGPIFKQFSNSNIQNSNEVLVLNTTYLFKYLIKNLHKDKSRLAATTQAYLANGLIEIIRDTKYEIQNTFFAGGMANNKIISFILESKGVYTNKKIPRGDAGISFGQIFYCFLTNPRD